MWFNFYEFCVFDKFYTQESNNLYGSYLNFDKIIKITLCKNFLLYGIFKATCTCSMIDKSCLITESTTQLSTASIWTTPAKRTPHLEQTKEVSKYCIVGGAIIYNRIPVIQIINVVYFKHKLLLIT